MPILSNFTSHFASFSRLCLRATSCLTFLPAFTPRQPIAALLASWHYTLPAIAAALDMLFHGTPQFHFALFRRRIAPSRRV